MELAKLFGIEYYDQNVTGRKITQLGRECKIRTYTSEIPNYGTLWGLVQLWWITRKIEAMAAKVDITDPYASCAEALDWDNMTVESFFRQHTRQAAQIRHNKSLSKFPV